MGFSLSRWRLPHLIGAWLAYWLVLLVTGGTPLASPIVHALSGPSGTGSISAAVGNGLVSLTVKAGATSVLASATFLSIALWIAGPPLLLWALWIATRSRPVARERVY